MGRGILESDGHLGACRRTGVGEDRKSHALPMVAQAMALWEVLWAEDYWNQMDTWTPADAQEKGQEKVQNGGPSAQGSQAGRHSLLLYFIAALTLRHRRRIIDDCRDQAGSSVLQDVCSF